MAKAVLVPLGEMPRIVEANSLKDLQHFVGGYIDAAGWIFNDEPTVYVNDDGKYTCMPNRAVYATADDAGKIGWDGKPFKEGDVLDIIFGDFICIGFDAETGEDRDITDEEIARVMARFGTSYFTGGKINGKRKIRKN